MLLTYISLKNQIDGKYLDIFSVNPSPIAYRKGDVLSYTIILRASKAPTQLKQFLGERTLVVTQSLFGVYDTGQHFQKLECVIGPLSDL